jgi:hypothetical protein
VIELQASRKLNKPSITKLYSQVWILLSCNHIIEEKNYVICRKMDGIGDHAK